MAARRVRSRFSPFGSLVAVLGVAVLGLLVFLIRDYADRPADTVAVSDAAVSVSADWQKTFPDRVDALTARLEQGPLAPSPPTIELQGGGAVQYSQRRYEISVARDEEKRVLDALELARGDEPSVTVSLTRDPDWLQADFGVDGLLTHSLTVHWRFPKHEGPARVAVIIDDLGNNLLVARELVSLDFPVTLAVMPLRPFSREVAALARHYGRDVLLHLPMEPERGAGDGDAILLRAGADRDEILRELDRALAAVPNAIGVNNHMGSRFTRDRERMSWVLGVLKERGLFFVDSRTSPRSVAREAAEAAGLPYLSRTVFLDDPGDEASVEEQLNNLLAAAQERGSAIGIGHPRRATMEALRSFGTTAKSQGVEVVPVSALASSSAPH